MPSDLGTGFWVVSLVLLASAVAAVSGRHLVHCALSLVVALSCVALLYLQLGAQFVGLGQILVYVGAVAILIVFAILLTRGGGAAEGTLWSGGAFWGAGVAILVFGCLATVAFSERVLAVGAGPRDSPAGSGMVGRMGVSLMTEYVVVLEAVGLLLTVALIGAVLLARREPAEPK